MRKEHLSAVWYDVGSLSETEGIRERCNASLIEDRLKSMFPEENISVTEAYIHEKPEYNNEIGKDMPLFLRGTTKCIDLPEFCFIRIEHELPDGATAHVIVWSPLKWNDRFLGTAGGGTETGGEGHLMRAENSTRGSRLSSAVCNGFSGATSDSGNLSQWSHNMDPKALDWDRIKNWSYLGTHWMTLIGKAVTEILHERPIKYSYMTGGSGGGRQCLAEAQRYPEDYHGIWASFYPGMRFWNKMNLPITAMIFTKKNGKKVPDLFPLFADHGKWMSGDPDFVSAEVTIEDFYRLLEAAEENFKEFETDNVDLSKFALNGGKLVVDHGTSDPLISPKGIVNYYQGVKNFFKDDRKVSSFFKVFITPGDGHGNCSADLPGITYNETMKLITAWVEEGNEPVEAKTMQVSKITKKLLKTGTVSVLE